MSNFSEVFQGDHNVHKTSFVILKINCGEVTSVTVNSMMDHWEKLHSPVMDREVDSWHQFVDSNIE